MADEPYDNSGRRPQDVEMDDDTNSIDTFPPLTETPATMSPAPAHVFAMPDNATAGPSATNADDECDDECECDDDDDDDSWTTETEPDQELDAADRSARTASFFMSPTTVPPSSRWLTNGRYRDMRNASKLNALNPYKLALNGNSVDSCLKLEEACYPGRAAERDAVSGPSVLIDSHTDMLFKLHYQIVTAGLSIGLFTSVLPTSPFADLPTYETSPLAQPDSERRIVLLAHAICTLSANDRLTTGDFAIPTGNGKSPFSVGHNVQGRTLALHSLAVLPAVSGRKIGTILLRSLGQMAASANVADRISLVVKKEVAGWFRERGYRCVGKSALSGPEEDLFDMVGKRVLLVFCKSLTLFKAIDLDAYRDGSEDT
jgi:hypothetical protein